MPISRAPSIIVSWGGGWYLLVFAIMIPYRLAVTIMDAGWIAANEVLKLMPGMFQEQLRYSKCKRVHRREHRGETSQQYDVMIGSLAESRYLISKLS